MTATLKNDLLLRALACEPTPRRPIWLMRQAGRYLPEYRATRARAGDFLSLCTNPDYACEVPLQPIARYPLDAAILFSDILTIPHAMNLGLEFEAGEGPTFKRPVRSSADIDKLGIPDPGSDLRYVVDAVALIRRELGGRVPLIGFAGSPWTVATYMVEGGGSKAFGHTKRMMYEAPRDLHRLLDLLARATVVYLNAQIAAGAQAVMVFDTWGGILTPRQYEDFSLRYMAQVVDGLTHESQGRRVPNIVFTKGGGPWLAKIAAIGCDAGVDWTMDLATAPSSPVHESRCRATSIPRPCSRRPRRCARKRCGCSTALGRARGMFSISATASRPTSIPSGWRCLSTLCAATCRARGGGLRSS